MGRILASLSPNSHASTGSADCTRVSKSPGSPAKRLGARSPLKKVGGNSSRSPTKAVLGRAAMAAAAVGAPGCRGGTSGLDEWGWSSASPTKEQARRTSDSAVAHYRRELDVSNATCDALRDEMGELQRDLHSTNQNYASLRLQNLGLQKREVAREVCGEAGDPLAEQVRQQLETLVNVGAVRGKQA